LLSDCFAARAPDAIVIAEKEARSTSDRSLVHFEYRPNIGESRRPLLLQPDEKTRIPTDILHYSPRDRVLRLDFSLQEHIGRKRS
jgi:hypothetical protein